MGYGGLVLRVALNLEDQRSNSAPLNFMDHDQAPMNVLPRLFPNSAKSIYISLIKIVKKKKID